MGVTVKPRAAPRTRRFLTTLFQADRDHTAPIAAISSNAGTGRLGDRVILGFAVGVLLAVAGAAAYVSYHHFYALAIALGEPHDRAILYPAMSDGVIVMASLVMVYSSRRRMRVPVLAWVALALGGAVTLAANVAHGWSGGLGSRLVSALAPLAFGLLMWIVRNNRRPTEETRRTGMCASPSRPLSRWHARCRYCLLTGTRQHGSAISTASARASSASAAAH
ncbi:DUF2637 domain-containing protein [Nonomuraea sp. NPDC000554]|uniref:DUF2637 domain-containing protein n=1 Tax=Nonomuraea sp. NPDC000554 TaxID=3154259 RepID=UPI003324B10F